MQPTCEELVNYQIQAVESGIGLGHRSLYPRDILQKTKEAAGFADYEYVTFAELIEELMEFKPVHPDTLLDIESESSAELGPQRFAQLKALLLSVWQDDRMI